MGRSRTTKRDLILEEARQRIRTAEMAVAAAEDEIEELRKTLTARQAALNAYQVSYEALERSLAPQPRQSAGMTASTARPACSKCDYEKGHVIHRDMNMTGAHKFVAAEKPSTKKRAKVETQVPIAETFVNELCQHVFEGGIICYEPPDTNIHHLRGVTNFHPFSSGVNAAQGLSPNGAEQSSTQNLGAVTESAAVAAGGSSE